MKKEYQLLETDSFFQQMKKQKRIAFLYILLRVIVVLIMVAQIINGNYENAFICLLTLLLFILPSFIQKSLHIKMPTALEIIILLFIFAAEILGEIGAYYTLYPIWDDLLHATNGFIAAAIGFSLIKLMNHKQKPPINLSPLSWVIIAFCFSMTIGLVWEFFEFGVDNILNKDMQKDTVIAIINSVYLDPTNTNQVISLPLDSLLINGQDWMNLYGGYLDIGLYDTMTDLLVNSAGALVFVIIAYINFKNKKLANFVNNFLIQSTKN
jgi:hypothetical protein